MGIQQAAMIIAHEKVYLPKLGRTPMGLYWECGPYLEAPLDVNELARTLASVIDTGNPVIPHPTQEEFRKWTPTEKALGTRSYRKLAQQGVISCAVSWLESGIAVAFSPPDAKDIQVVDYSSQKMFPLDANLSDICQYILSEVKARRNG